MAIRSSSSGSGRTEAQVSALAGPLPPAVLAFGDAGLGIQWASLRLQDDHSASSRPLTGKAKAALSSLGGGAEIRLIDDPRVKFSLRTQVHYQVATSMSFDATPMAGGDDKLEIATESAPLGSINTTGLVFRAGLVGSF